MSNKEHQELSMSIMWQTGVEQFGLEIEPDHKRIRWFTSIGSLCGDDEEGCALQLIEQFNIEGPPGHIGPLPDEVTEEINRVIESLLR